MKLGGLTWWRNNYGSILQAYALQTELNSTDGIEYEIINQYGKKIVSTDNFLKKVSSIGLKKTLVRAFWKIGFKGVRTRSKTIQEFVDSRLFVSNKEYSLQNIAETNNYYDGFICGSDQIWNPTLTSLDSIYWLTFADKNKLKIAYAPSLGVGSLSDEEKIIIRRNLESYTSVSCREKSGTDFLNSFISTTCENVLDPTLLVDKSIWDALNAEPKVNSPYVFAYILRGNKKQRKIVEQYAKLKGLKVVTLPFLETENIVWYDLQFGDVRLWDVSPADFINLIKNAECIFTDSYHATVFSCIYHKNYYNFPKKGKAQASRIQELHKLFGISERMISRIDDIKNIQPISEWKHIDEVLELERIKSKRYLYGALERR